MTFKRRNGGRSKHGRGHVRFLRCDNCGKSVPKDKAIKRYSVKNIVAAEGIRDFNEACVLEGYHLPKIYIKERWCIGCAIHRKEIGVRARKDRKNRAPPERLGRRGPRPERQAPRPGGVGGGPGGVGGGPGGVGVGAGGGYGGGGAGGGYGGGGAAGGYGGGGAAGGFGAGAPAPNIVGGWPQN